MSTKVKERLKNLMLELDHDERVLLDNALEQLYLAKGGIIVKEEKGCDKIIEQIPDKDLIEIVSRIKKKRQKKKILLEAE